MERYTRMLFAILLLMSVTAVTASPVDINTADAQTLADNLSGIGISKANAIVAYRDRNGPFQAADELIRVKGVGEKILELNRDSITIGTLPVQ
ncbi:MAG: helix-hairpin-helix domain-containing protein [Gammaproteobacteria bacterium]|nr:helix-hairpin-helix domain-containing protein [Gammaproteobacteria bacterium]